MKTDCPHCGVQGSADDSYLGRNIKCPECLGVFAFRVNQTSSGVMVGTSCPHCGVKGRTDRNYLHRQVRCPKCQGLFKPLAARQGNELGEDQQRPTDTEELSELTIALDQVFTESGDHKSQPYPERGLAESATTAQHPPSQIEPATDQLLDFDDSIEMPAALASLPQESTDPANQQPVLADSTAEDELLSPSEETLEIDDDFDLPVLTDDDEQTTAKDRPDNPENISVEPNLSHLTAPESLAEGIQEVEREPYGVDGAQCWQCGKKEQDETFHSLDDRLYCGQCLPAREGADKAGVNQRQTGPEAAVTAEDDDQQQPGENKKKGGGLLARLRGWLRPSKKKK